MKLLKISLSTFSILLLTNCALFGPEAPKKPTIELCVLDVPAGEAICGTTNGADITSASSLGYYRVVEIILASGTAHRVPIADLDRAIALKPAQYTILKNYIGDMERYARDKICEP